MTAAHPAVVSSCGTVYQEKSTEQMMAHLRSSVQDDQRCLLGTGRSISIVVIDAIIKRKKGLCVGVAVVTRNPNVSLIEGKQRSFPRRCL